MIFLANYIWDWKHRVRRILMFLGRLSWLSPKAWKTKHVLMRDLSIYYKRCWQSAFLITWTLKHLFWLYFRMKGWFTLICFWKCTGLGNAFVFTEGSMQRWSTYLTGSRLVEVHLFATFVCCKGSAKANAFQVPPSRWDLKALHMKETAQQHKLNGASLSEVE